MPLFVAYYFFNNFSLQTKKLSPQFQNIFLYYIKFLRNVPSSTSTYPTAKAILGAEVGILKV